MDSLPLTESHIPLFTSENKYGVPEHLFDEAKQCNPELEEHEAEPHSHAASFALTPSV